MAALQELKKNLAADATALAVALADRMNKEFDDLLTKYVAGERFAWTKLTPEEIASFSSSELSQFMDANLHEMQMVETVERIAACKDGRPLNEQFIQGVSKLLGDSNDAIKRFVNSCEDADDLFIALLLKGR